MRNSVASRGGVTEPLKISQVAEYIDQIETGGGGKMPVNFEMSQDMKHPYYYQKKDGYFVASRLDYEDEPVIFDITGKAEAYHSGNDWLQDEDFLKGNFYVLNTNNGAQVTNVEFTKGEEKDKLKVEYKAAENYFHYEENYDTLRIVFIIMFYAQEQWWTVPVYAIHRN